MAGVLASLIPVTKQNDNMRNLLKSILILIVVAVMVSFVREAQLNNQKLELKSIEVKDTSAELKVLNQKYDEELNNKTVNEQKLQELQKQLEEKDKQLQAKKASEATLASKGSPVAYASPVGSEAEAKAFIYAHESGNNPGAINKSSGACGLGQALPCSKMGCSLSDYACQDAWFTGYMQSRYGSWSNAVSFWRSHKWW